MNESGIVMRILPIGNYSFYLEILIALMIFLLHGKKR